MRWLVPSLAEKEGGNHSFIRKGKKRGLRQISEKKKYTVKFEEPLQKIEKQITLHQTCVQRFFFFRIKQQKGC